MIFRQKKPLYKKIRNTYNMTHKTEYRVADICPDTWPGCFYHSAETVTIGSKQAGISSVSVKSVSAAEISVAFSFLFLIVLSSGTDSVPYADPLRNPLSARASFRRIRRPRESVQKTGWYSGRFFLYSICYLIEILPCGSAYSSPTFPPIPILI